MNIIELQKKFSTQRKCLSYLGKVRWPNGVICPRCQSDSVSRIKTRGNFDCNKCRYMFSVTSGTIYHKTHLPLSKWLIATHIMCNAKKGVSAKQIQRTLIVTYKTAWYLCHRIRIAMKEKTFKEKFKGVVEVDETYIGGKVRRFSGDWLEESRFKNKIPVMGILERGGQVRCQAVGDTTKFTMTNVIKKYVDQKAKSVYTDEHPSYKTLSKVFTHKSINHIKSYVKGDVHTNGIENFWSILKRGIYGNYHKVSRKYLSLYLNEFTYRFNNRNNPQLFEAVLNNSCK